EQLNFLHHFPVVGASLLEAQVHHAHTALVMERLQLLHDGIGPPHQTQQPLPGLDRLPGPLGAAGSAVTGAQVKSLAGTRRADRPETPVGATARRKSPPRPLTPWPGAPHAGCPASRPVSASKIPAR